MRSTAGMETGNNIRNAVWPESLRGSNSENYTKDVITFSELEKRLIKNKNEIDINDSLKILDAKTNFNSEQIVEWAIGETEYMIDLTEDHLS